MAAVGVGYFGGLYVFSNADIGRTSAPFRPLQLFLQSGTVDSARLAKGWSRPEPWGTWTTGEQAHLSLTTQGTPRRDLELTLTGQVFLAPPRHESQEIGVDVNGSRVATWQITRKNQNGPFTARIPAHVIKSQWPVELVLLIKRPRAPVKLGVNADARELGIGVHSVVLRETGS
ncbi:MAG: hypothetical protein ACKVP3_08660 [Hyphomicrobiaceae bacterium]